MARNLPIMVVAQAGDYTADDIVDTAQKVMMTVAERAKLTALDPDRRDDAVSSVHGRTGAVTAQPGDYNAEQIADTAEKVLMTAAERVKLDTVEEGAQVNDVASVHGRTGAVTAQPGDYNAEQIADTAEKVLMTAAERVKLDTVENGAQVNDVASVHGRTGAVVAAPGDYNADQIADTAAKVLMTAGERAKLDAVEEGAQVNAVASVHGRSGIVTAASGDYNADQIFDGTAKVVMTAGERSKLNGIAPLSTPNPIRVTAAEKTAGTGTTIRGFAPVDVRDIVATFAPVAPVASVAGRTGAVTLAKTDVGLGNVTDDAQIRENLAYTVKATPASGDKLLLRDQADGLPKLIDWCQLPVPAVPVTSVHGRTGMVVGQQGDYNSDQLNEGTQKLLMTPAERTRLAGVEDHAQVNPVRIAAAEKTAGTGTTIRGFAPVDVRDIVATFAPVAPVASVAGRTGAVTLAKTDVGLGNVTDDAQIRASLAYTVKATPASGDKLLLRDQADGLPKLIDWCQLPVPAVPVTSVHGRTGVIVGQQGDYNSDQLTEGTQKLLMTPAERTRLAGVEDHAQVNPVRIIAAEKTAGTSTTIRAVAPIDVKDMIGTHGVRVALDYPVKASPATGDKILVRDQVDGSIKLVDWNSAVAALKSEADPFPQYTTTTELATALATKADITNNLIVIPVMFAAVTLANVTNVEAGGINRAYLDLSRASRARMSINIGAVAGTTGQVAKFEYSLEATPSTWVALGPTLPLDVAVNAGYASAWIDIPAVCKQATGVWVRVCVSGGTASSVVLRNLNLLIENVCVPAGTPATSTVSNTYLLDVTGNTTDLLFGVGSDVAMTLRTISARTVSGTCTIAFKRNATAVLDTAGGSSWAINASSAPITLSTSTPQALPAYGKLYLTVTGASALSGLIIVISGAAS